MEDEINLIQYFRIIARRWRMITAVVLVVTACSVLISLLLPKIYKAEATIMPIGGSKSGGLQAAALTQMGLGALLANLGATSSSSVQIIALLNSRTLAERMIEKYGLMEVLYSKLWDQEHKKWKVSGEDQPTMEDAVAKLFQHVTFTDNKKAQTIKIKLELADPGIAAEIVNNYIRELTYFINGNTFTVAKRNRIFLEDQLERNKAELLESGKELAAFYSTKKISNVIPTLDVDVSLTSGILQKTVGQTIVGQTSSPINPSPMAQTLKSLQETQEKAQDLQEQARSVQEKIQKVRIVKNVPQQVYLQYLTLRRELLVQVNSLLTQQYELAKAEEAKEDLNFQVIDWAKAPIRKYKPNRLVIVITSFITSLFLILLYTIFRDYLERMKSVRA